MAEVVACRGIIFDLDGTLLDTLQDLAGAMNQVLRRLGYPAHPPEAYKLMVGDGMLNLARRALPAAARGEAMVQAAAAALREEYSRRWQFQTEPYAGLPAVLAQLGRRLPMAVLSNKPDDLAKRMMAAFFPLIPFAAVWGAAPSRPLKPDPAGALGLARLLGLKPEQVCLVGDSGVDLATARAAGMQGVGVLWGFRPAAELRAAGARTLLARPADLLSLVPANGPV